MFQQLAVDTSTLVPLYAVAGFFVGVIGAIPFVMVKAFPPVVRFSGISFSYNVAYAVFGGLTPIAVSLMMKSNPMAAPLYVGAICIVGCVRPRCSSRTPRCCTRANRSRVCNGALRQARRCFNRLQAAQPFRQFRRHRHFTPHRNIVRCIGLRCDLMNSPNSSVTPALAPRPCDSQRRLRRHAARRDHRQHRAAEDRRRPACETSRACNGSSMRTRSRSPC